jgi:hypothetical protein
MARKSSMKRAVGFLVVGYLFAALVGHGLERAGLSRCDCASSCWCQRPGLSAFRWAFPRFHRAPADYEV